MAKSFINEYHQSWLYSNYPNKSNEELAALLTEMVGKDNETEIQRLNKQLEFVTQPTLRRKIQETIRWRSEFKPFTPKFITRVARRIGAPHKNVRLVAEANRQKARNTNIKRWENMAQHVKEPFAWLRSFTGTETRIVHISSPKEKRRIQDALSAYNRSEGLRTGIVFVSEQIKGTALLRVSSLTNNY